MLACKGEGTVVKQRLVGYVRVSLEIYYIGLYFPSTAVLQQIVEGGGEFRHIAFQLLLWGGLTALTLCLRGKPGW